MPSDKPTIAVRLTKQEHAAVVKAAKAEDRSLSSWVRLAIRQALKMATSLQGRC